MGFLATLMEVKAEFVYFFQYSSILNSLVFVLATLLLGNCSLVDSQEEKFIQILRNCIVGIRIHSLESISIESKNALAMLCCLAALVAYPKRCNGNFSSDSNFPAWKNRV